MKYRNVLTVMVGATAVVAFSSAGVAGASSGTPNVCTPTHHSSTGHGANTSPGPYTNTCDPSVASANGNGVGLAVGRPAAGTVGNADDKQPQGQLPNADLDGNNGYECDGNSGIAKGNPAHTGCDVKKDCPTKKS